MFLGRYAEKEKTEDLDRGKRGLAKGDRFIFFLFPPKRLENKSVSLHWKSTETKVNISSINRHTADSEMLRKKVLVQVLLKWLTLLLDIYYSNIITSGNISDGNVKLSGVWFLRVQELNCLDYRSDLDEADA